MSKSRTKRGYYSSGKKKIDYRDSLNLETANHFDRFPTDPISISAEETVKESAPSRYH